MNELIKKSESEVEENETIINAISEQEILNNKFKIYGTIENPLFLAKDVAKWIEHSNLTVMINNIDEDEKIISRTKDSLGRENSATFLTENGLYEVLMLSRKPIAKRFKKEVKKILHSLRLNGGYIVHQDELSPEEIVANALIVANRIIENKNKEIKQQKQRAEIAENKNALLMHSEKSYTISEIAKELGYKSAIEFNKILHDEKIIFKQNGTWLPYSEYSNHGYFEIKQTILDNEMVVYNLRVTQKGRKFLLNKFSV